MTVISMPELIAPMPIPIQDPIINEAEKTIKKAMKEMANDLILLFVRKLAIIKMGECMINPNPIGIKISISVPRKR